MKQTFRVMLTSPTGTINFRFKMKSVVALKINRIRYFQNTNNNELLICFNGLTQQIQNQNNIYFTKDFELTYNNTFSIYESSTIEPDYENLLEPQDINNIKYSIYIDSVIASTTQISNTNPIFISFSLFS